VEKRKRKGDTIMADGELLILQIPFTVTLRILRSITWESFAANVTPEGSTHIMGNGID
jgi:hypothetical protein